MKHGLSNAIQFGIILTVGFLLYMSHFMAAATVGLFANTMNAKASMVGIIGGAMGAMALVMRPISGQIVDNENNKTVLIFFAALICISNMCLLWAKIPFLILVSRGLFGLSWGICSTLLMTGSCNALSAGKMAVGISVFTMSQALAQLLGPFLALKILDFHSFRRLYSVTLSFAVVALTMSFFYKPKQFKKNKTKYTFDFRKIFLADIWAPTVMSMGNYMIADAMNAFIVLYATDINIADISWFFSLKAASMLLARPLMTAVTKGQYSKRFVVLCELLMISGVGILFFARGECIFLIAAVVQGVANAGAQPALMKLCVEGAAPEKRGQATNTNYAGCDIGAFMGPALSGVVIQAAGYRFAFVTISALLLIFLCIFSFAYKTGKEGLIKKN